MFKVTPYQYHYTNTYESPSKAIPQYSEYSPTPEKGVATELFNMSECLSRSYFTAKPIFPTGRFSDVTSIISVRDLVYEYPTKRALHGISFDLEPGTVTALVGPNGAGKTTLLHCLAALGTPYSGDVKVLELCTQTHPRQCHAKVGYLPDFFGLYNDLTVTQCLTYMALAHEVPALKVSESIDRVTSQLSLTEYRKSKASALSRGLRQRLAIAQAIIHQPPVLILDEPAAGLDPEARIELSELLTNLKNEGMTILVSSHILAELEDYSTHMLVIENGRLINHHDFSAAKDKSAMLSLETVSEHSDLDSILEANKLIHEISGKGIVRSFKFEGNPSEQHEFLKELVQRGITVRSFQELRTSMQDTYIAQVKKQREENA